MKKAIFSDLDGTLLQENHKFSRYTKKVLLAVQQQGTPVIITTGRLAIDAIRQAKKIRVNKFNGYVISNNGALVYSFENKNFIWLMYLNNIEINNIFNFTFNKYKVHFFSDKSIFVYSKGKNSYYWSKVMKIKYNIIDNLDQITENITHVTLISNDELLDYQAKKLVNKLETLMPGVQVVQYTNRVFQIMPKGVSKGHALRFLSNYIKVDIANTYSFGDSYNDLELITSAGNGIAVANAVSELKKVAKNLIASNVENGPAQYLIENIL